VCACEYKAAHNEIASAATSQLFDHAATTITAYNDAATVFTILLGTYTYIMLEQNSSSVKGEVLNTAFVILSVSIEIRFERRSSLLL